MLPVSALTPFAPLIRCGAAPPQQAHRPALEVADGADEPTPRYALRPQPPANLARSRVHRRARPDRQIPRGQFCPALTLAAAALQPQPPPPEKALEALR